MPRGAPKGTRYGGREKGAVNKRTKERLEALRIAEQAQHEVNKAQVAKVKLAKDVLEDYVGAFHNIAAFYQNEIAKAYLAGLPPKSTDLAAFKQWGGMVVDAADRLADYQSPKFKAIMIQAPPPSQPAPPLAIGKDGNVIDLPKDPVTLSRLYQQMIRKPA